MRKPAPARKRAAVASKPTSVAASVAAPTEVSAPAAPVVYLSRAAARAAAVRASAARPASRARPRTAASRKAAKKAPTAISPDRKATAIRKMEIELKEKVKTRWKKATAADSKKGKGEEPETKTTTTRLHDLFDYARKHGYVTHPVINDHLPEDMVDLDEAIHVIAKILRDLGISIYETTPDRDDLMLGEERTAIGTNDDIEDQAEAAISSFVGITRTTDPVRMYMREMSHSTLLTRQQEVEIARRIEKGLRSIMQVLSNCPKIVEEVLQRGDVVFDKNTSVTVEDVMDGIYDVNMPEEDSIKYDITAEKKPLTKAAAKAAAKSS